MFEQRLAFGVPNGVDVVVLHQSGAEARVRIDEPNRVYSGREGWVPAEWLRHRPNPGQADPSLPRYEILDKMGATIDVLVATLSPNRDAATLKRHLLEITRREGAGAANFYSTREAYDANVNGGTNPRTIDRAMKRGYLGRVENGVFQPSPY